jgi:hypothetical protein
MLAPFSLFSPLQGLKHWIFHKQPRVPRMCLMAPVLEPFVGPTTVSSAALVGTDAGVFFAASNATRRCEHWRFRHAGAQVEACLSRDPLPQPPAAPGAAAGAPAVEGLGLGLWRPLMIQHPLARIEVRTTTDIALTWNTNAATHTHPQCMFSRLHVTVVPNPASP